MFPRNFWYAAAYSFEVKRELLPRTILCEPILLYRKTDGTVAALIDRCSHRRASLSLGRLIGDTVECGYHGITFDCTGACVRIPAQEKIPPQAAIKAYPVAERDGFVWIWMGDPARAGLDKLPSYPMCGTPKFVGHPKLFQVKSSYTLHLDNVMDISHLPFLHPRTIGTMTVLTEPTTTVKDDFVEVSRILKSVEAPPFYKRALGVDLLDRYQAMRFWPGGNTMAYNELQPAGNTDPAKVYKVIFAGPITPETETTYHDFIGVYRDFNLDDDELTDVLTEQLVQTVHEDFAMQASQQLNYIADGPEAPTFSMAFDKGPLAVRRILRRLCESERIDRSSTSIRADPI
jgi:phenylpropionate dioxygenase-like ring-hydroxylating dioxygenase large terminal subunit